MATRTANHTTPQGGGGTESRAKPRTTPHHTTGGAGLQADPNPEPHRTTGGVGGGRGTNHWGGGGGRPNPDHMCMYLYIYIYYFLIFCLCICMCISIIVIRRWSFQAVAVKVLGVVQVWPRSQFTLANIHGFRVPSLLRLWQLRLRALRL